MTSWWVSIYGDPCRECGFDWTIPTDDARALVAALPSRYGGLLGGSDGSQRHPDLAWSAKAHVSHVADNLRIWAQRLAGAVSEADRSVPRYHARALAQARTYEALPLPGVMWSLEKAVAEWLEAVEVPLTRGVVLHHPDRGPQRTADVVLANAHDAYHHAWDIACCLGRAERVAGSPAREPDVVLAGLVEATGDLETTVARMVPGQLAEPSLLPDWTRAHVLSHLARNADGLRNLLLAARTGEPLRMYASPKTRSADIEVGAKRPADVIIDDATEAARRFVIDARSLPEEAWSVQVAFSSGGPNPPLVPAHRLLGMRVEEVVIHHVDLGLDYGFDSVSHAVLVHLFEALAGRRRRQGLEASFVATDAAISAGSGVPVVRGHLSDLVAWLAGRSESGLVAEGGPLPTLPPLG